MYTKSIETSRDKKEAHNAANKKLAGDRALARLSYNKAHPKKKKGE